MCGIACTPDDPVPITPTRSPVKSTPSCGQRPVWYHCPLKSDRPGKSGTRGVERLPGRHDDEGGADGVALVRRDRPEIASAVEAGREDARVERHVLAQVEAVGNVLDVLEDLRLSAVALGPVPLLLQLGRERVGVLEALDVAATARIAIPVPGAAEPGPRLECMRLEAELSHLVERVEATEAAADDDDVEVRARGAGIRLGGRSGLHRFLPLSSCQAALPN